MPARTFEDSRGATWEVFEVHRASDKPGAVSAGLELGWLAFVSGAEKRRLAPYPSDWAEVAAAELERLCARARVASAVAVARAEARRPRIRPSALEVEMAMSDPPELAASPAGREREADAMPGLAELPEVERTVRTFAREARTAGMPAIAAMVRLKADLAQRFPGVRHPARDNRLVRRWFVDSYYFERDA